MEARIWAHTPQNVEKLRNNPEFVEFGTDDNGNKVFKTTKIEVVLSKREKEIYDLKEKSNEEIAKALCISEKSVESYRNKIKHKGF